MTEPKLNHEGESRTFLGIIQALVVLAFIGGSLALSMWLKNNDRPEANKSAEARILFAETTSVAAADFPIQFVVSGNVTARGEIGLVPQVSGRVSKVNDNIFAGGEFNAGEVLFEIEAIDFELAVKRLEADLARAQTALQLEQAATEAARAEWRQLNGEQPIPSLVAREPQLLEASANLEAAEAQLQKARLDLKRTRFSLPFAGRVLSSKLERGQFVAAGQAYGQVYDVAGLEVQASLEDKQLNWLQQGEHQQITLLAEHLAQQNSYQAYLKRGAAAMDGQTRFAQVSFGFKQPPPLLPGVFVQLQINGPVLESVLILPLAALQKDGSIWAVDQQQQLYPLNGEIVFSDSQHVVVAGIQQAQQVVTSRLPGAIAGMQVKLASTAEP